MLLQIGLAARVTQLEAQLRAQSENDARGNSVAISQEGSEFDISHVPQKRKLPTDSGTMLQPAPVYTDDRRNVGGGMQDDPQPYAFRPRL